ncbi:hypothetical protein AB4K20DRAFT_1862527 [Rhizopus microsporus]
MTITQYRSYQDRFPAEPTEELDVEMEEAAEELSKEVAGGRKYNVYSDKHKAVFYYFNRVKLWKAAPSARKAQVEIRTGQIWAKRLKEDPQWNIYEKQTNKVNRLASQLQENHKKHLIDFFDIYPQATRQDAVESLTEAFENFNLKTTAVGNFILYECNLTVKRSLNTLVPMFEALGLLIIKRTSQRQGNSGRYLYRENGALLKSKGRRFPTWITVCYVRRS